MKHAINEDGLYRQDEETGNWIPLNIDEENSTSPELEDGDFWYFEAGPDAEQSAIWKAYREIQRLLGEIKAVDANGWALLTDGSLDDLHLIEQLGELREVIAEHVRIFERQEGYC